MGFEQQLDQLREFYLAVAGAAAVLPGIAVLAVPVLLPIGWFVVLVVGGVGVIARRPFGLYLLAAGSAALIASATRNTWDLLVFGRTQGLE